VRITRQAEAVPYAAPLHTGVDTRRLQGLEAGPSENFWVGLSVYPPGGIAESSPTRAETVYVVLDGELTLTCEGQHTLGTHDSVHFGPGETRELINASDQDATMLVIIAYPKEN
jgi:quercetin dioxygenase-like cupin family protein